MKPPARSARLISLTLMAVLLFTPPLLLLFDRPNALGFSILPIYLFSVWILLLIAAAWIMESPAHFSPPSEKKPPHPLSTEESDDAS